MEAFKKIIALKTNDFLLKTEFTKDGCYGPSSVLVCILRLTQREHTILSLTDIIRHHLEECLSLEGVTVCMHCY